VQVAVVQVVLVCMELVVLVYNHLYPEHQHIIQAVVAGDKLEEPVVLVAVVRIVVRLLELMELLTQVVVVAALLVLEVQSVVQADLALLSFVILTLRHQHQRQLDLQHIQ
jgi:hypothetical protein